jgi:hypothetical protein
MDIYLTNLVEVLAFFGCIALIMIGGFLVNSKFGCLWSWIYVFIVCVLVMTTIMTIEAMSK